MKKVISLSVFILFTSVLWAFKNVEPKNTETISCGCSSLPIKAKPTADSYTVKPYSDYLPELKAKHQIILESLKDPNLQVDERLRRYDEEIKKLKQAFIADRSAEYNSKAVTLSVQNWCTSKSSGGKKNCGFKCITPPAEGLVTDISTFRVVGHNKGTEVRENGKYACLKMTVAGKGKNKGTLFAVYRYGNEFVQTTVDRELNELFKDVVKP